MVSPGQATAAEDIQLSVVATSRNDNHGASLTARMQHFVDGFVAQCKRHGLRAELILVEWNPPRDRVPLIDELRWPSDTGPCDIRVITVPREVHQSFEHADKIPLFQMIAKNAGIRRARGRFVLATNIDILFSDGVIRFMRDRLRAGIIYRTARVDIPADVPRSADFGEVLQFCHAEGFRLHAHGITVIRRSARWSRLDLVKASLDPRVMSAIQVLKSMGSRAVRMAGRIRNVATGMAIRIWSAATALTRLLLRKGPSSSRLGGRRLTVSLLWQECKLWGCDLTRSAADLFARLTLGLPRFKHRAADLFASLVTSLPFTNACGDFTLLSRADWFKLRGYAEWKTFSWHLDSLLMYQAVAAGVKEKRLSASQRIFHIEHGKGYTPEAAAELFSRLSLQGIPFLTDAELRRLRLELATKSRVDAETEFNDASWGMGDIALPEICPASKVLQRPAASEKLKAFS